MLRTSAAMLPSRSALRSLLNLSRRSIRLPNPRLPTTPLLRLVSSSPSPSGGGGCPDIHDPLAAASSVSAASNPEMPADSDASSVEKEVIKGKGRSTAGRGEARWAAAAAARRGGGKAAKARVSYVCSNCGEGSSQWWGVCCHCQVTGTLTKYVIPEDPDTQAESASAEGSHHARRSWIPQKSKEMVPQRLQDVTKGFDQAEWRIPLPGNFGMEIARVLGGGIVPGSLTLVGGDPGVGKSSLMLQLASMVSDGSKDNEPSPVVYVSGEESIEQIGNRAERMSIRSRYLYLYSSTDIEDIFDKIQPLSPRALIVDSIQTVYLSAFAGSAGNQVQVKECTSALLRFAKTTNIPVFLIGHVTKTGDIAGPRTLEHIVDVVLYMEGERCLSHRLLRSVKNRFGSTDELGVFEMSEHGLQAVQNPSEMFLTEHDSNSEILAGLAVAVVLDGSRTFAIEVQALCVSGSCSGKVVGIPSKRADVIIAVLMKQAGLKLQDNAIFLNVVNGFKLTETAGDLAIAASVCSSFLEFPIPNDIAFIGEIGLGGELRTVPRMDKRVIAITKLGYRKCIVPKTSEKLLKPLNLDIEILPCSNLKEVINTVFRPQG